MTDSDENLVLGYFDYADFKNLVSFALGRRILELAIFAGHARVVQRNGQKFKFFKFKSRV